MKHARKAILFMIILVIPLLLAGVLPPAINDEVTATISPIITKVSLPSYENMTPILAYNNFDMDNYASALEWAGDGSPGDPYIIEGYNITSNSDSILIRHTTRAFEIRNCLITSFTSGSGNGIMIDNVTQAGIVDTVVMDKSDTIDVRHVPTLYIENCTVYDGGSSIYIYNCTGVTITECNISDNFDHGIYLNACNNSMISNNVINGTSFGAGIRLFDSHVATIIGNHIFNCRASGVWASYSPNATIEENIIHDNLYWLGPMCGVHLDQSPYASIVGNEIFDNSRNGIYVYNSDWANIFDNDIYGNSEHGIDSIFSSNGTILQNDIHSNGWWPTMTNSLCGIFLGSSDDWVISENTIWNNTPSGISLEGVMRVTIANNEIFNNTDFGIFGVGVDESVILENQIYGMGWSDTISDDQCGIYLDGSGEGIGHNITNNEIYDSNGHGILLYNGEDHVVDSNIIHHNNFSIYVDIDGGVNVTNNIVYDNSIGILLEYADGSWIYGNDFGWNDVNALDITSGDQVYWTDNVSIGNHWQDYNGGGIYWISNGTHGVSSDLYPSISLNLTQANPITFEILATGIVEWEAYALNPSHYELFIDGSFVMEAPWDGDDIAINVDSLSHGTHTIGIEVFHISGHSMENGTTADVEDLTPPSDIVGPSLIEIAFGDDISALFSSGDPSGLDWAVNDTVNFAIDSTGLLTSLTELPVGDIVVRITVSDPYGHSATLDVTISVEAPAGLPTELILAIGVGGVIVILIVVAIGYKTKRG